ncbi:oxidoreductase [Saccharomonospora piscinae]|uniref:Oxidoreductase n=1 Tax=Saccharomonospora piscinae TaxID=687388 RepID=A0A1V9ADG9_SACPI|nr:NAD(P)/FAD-dependent oxidoreductase [Saccharomonospora piscinae]OQO95078.1 oxidoreductase [Saccharomonospora piscinae]
MPATQQVSVIGAGLAGLAAATHLAEAGVGVRVLERAEAPGGRVRTDHVDGFRLDRGFQVLLPAYPEFRRLVRPARLGLRGFTRGALVRDDGGMRLLAGPWHGPRAVQDVARFVREHPGDVLALARLALRDAVLPASALRRAPEHTVGHDLRERCGTETVETLLRPFVAGVFLDPGLGTSARLFHLIWRSFVLGGAAVPELGMQALPQLLADRLPPGTVETGQEVAGLGEHEVRLTSGETVSADAVVVATDGTTAARLLPDIEPPAWHAVTTWYYRTERPPLSAPTLALDGTGDLPLNSLVNSQAAPTYAPQGTSLVQASVPGIADSAGSLEPAVRERLAVLYDTDTRDWGLLATYPIEHALPVLGPDTPLSRPVRVRRGRYVCGDHRDTPSIQGALVSGRRAAQAVLADLGRR